MAFAKPLVIDYAAGTKTLQFINQDNNGSEYYLREATQEFTVKIRHTSERPDRNGIIMERHNVEFTRTVFGTGVDPDITQQAYLVFRMQRRDSAADAALIGESMSKLMVKARFEDLAAWMI